MFDQGHKIKKAAEEDIVVKLTVMALLTLSYVHNIHVAMWVFFSYFIVRVLFWEILEDMRKAKVMQQEESHKIM
jgi:hypothetical protein